MATTEQELLELLQHEQARNSGTAQPTAQPRPVTQEARFAQQLRGVGEIPAMSKDAYLNELIAGLNTGITPITGGPIVAVRTTPADVAVDVYPATTLTEGRLTFHRPTAQTVAPPGPVTSGTVTLQASQQHSVRELEQLWARPGEDLETELPEAQQFQGNDAILANLWDSTVPEGAQEGDYQPDPQVFRQEVMGVWNPDDIQFEDSDEIQFNDEGPGISRQGREATRFRVDREDPPPRPPIDRFATPVDGQVVSQRGADGRFEAVQRPPPPRHGRETGVPFPDRPPRQPKRTTPVVVDRSNLPTAWDRVMGDDDF